MSNHKHGFEFPPDSIFENDINTIFKDVYRNKPSKLDTFDERAKAFITYTKNYDMSINGALRSGKGYISELISKIINDMWSYLDDIDFIEPILLYRGVVPWTKFDVGMKFIDLGFSSKSLNEYEARKFPLNEIDKNTVILILAYPEISKQVFLGYSSYYGHELEVLSYPGEIFEVAEIATHHDRLMNKQAIYCRYIGNVYTNNPIYPKENKFIDDKFDEHSVLKDGCYVFHSTKGNKYVLDIYIYDIKKEYYGLHMLKPIWHSLSYDNISWINLSDIFNKIKYTVDKEIFYHDNEIIYQDNIHGIITEHITSGKDDYEFSLFIISLIENTCLYAKINNININLPLPEINLI